MGTVTWVERAPSESVPGWNPDPDRHHSRILARRIITDPDDSEAWSELANFYATQADTWQEWSSSQPGYAEALRRALKGAPRGIWLEFGAGTGESLAAMPPGQRVLHTELLIALVSLAPHRPGSVFVVADARALPVAAASVVLLFGLNSIPALTEVRRVLRPEGELVLAYSFGDHTPVYLEPQEIADQLGKEWMGEAAGGIWGQWARFWRH